MSFVINGEIVYKKEHCTTETLRLRVHGTELWLNRFDMSGEKPVALIMNRTPKLLTANLLC